MENYNEDNKIWGKGSYVMLAFFLLIYLSQIENLKNDYIVIFEAIIAGLISGLLFYPTVKRLRGIKNENFRNVLAGIILYVVVGTIVKLLLVAIVVQ